MGTVDENLEYPILMEEYDMVVITITYDGGTPEVDLDNCPPQLAMTIFAQAIEMINSALPLPTITYRGVTISEDFTGEDE